MILIIGLRYFFCGNIVEFIVVINLENFEGWLVKWLKYVKCIEMFINLNVEKYYGSIEKYFVI